MNFIADVRDELLRLAERHATPLQLIQAAYSMSGIQKGIEQDLRDPDATLRDAALGRQERIHSLFSIADEAHATSTLADQLTSSDLAASSHNGNVLTMHAAKGVEWDAVTIAALDENAFPPAGAFEHHLLEERRLLHVACTRARRLFVLTHCQGHNNETRQPSRFLTEIRETIPNMQPDNGRR